MLSGMDAVHDLLIVAAMESEEQALLQGTNFHETTLGNRTRIAVREIALPRCRVRVARSGIGLVNAGSLLALLAEQLPIDAVLLLGVGGALDPRLEIGDLVVAHSVLQHDSVSSLPDGNVFIAPGELTLSRAEPSPVNPIFRCDPVLHDWVMRIEKEEGAGQILSGTLLSGSEFVGTPERKKQLRGFGDDAWLVDMEAAALGQVARRLGIPYLAAKTVADRALPDGTIAHDYVKFLHAAAQHSRVMMRGLVRQFS